VPHYSERHESGGSNQNISHFCGSPLFHRIAVQIAQTIAVQAAPGARASTFTIA
jgi:hypothetical protein